MPSLWFWHQTLVANPLCQQFQNWAVGVTIVVLVALIAARAPRPRRCAWSSERVAVLLVLAMTFVVSLWNWPVADDWSWAAGARESGGFPLAIHSYLEWTGRYATYAAMIPYGWLIDPVIGSIVWSWILIGGMVVTAAFALRPCLPASRTGRRSAWVCAVGGTALWIVTMEWPGHGLFWFSATATYAIALPLLLAAIGIAQRAGHRPRTMVIAGTLLGVALGGIGESAALAAWVLVAGACLRSWMLGQPSRWCWSAVLAGLTAGFVANGCSPGTAQRAAALADGAGFDRSSGGVRSAGWTATWLLRSLADAVAWLTSPIALCAALAVIPSARLLARRMRPEERSGPGVLAAWVLVPGIVLAGYLPAFVIVGHGPPWRARDAIQGMVLIAAFAAWVRTVAWIRQRGWDPASTVLGSAAGIFAVAGLSWATAPRVDQQTLLMGACLLASLAACTALRRRLRIPRNDRPRRCGGPAFAAALLLWGSFPSLTADAVFNGPRWRSQQGVSAEILSAAAGRHAVVPPDVWADRPHHLWYWSIGNDPTAWRNRAVADWYGAASVRTGDPPDPAETGP